jgi:hypothetical protein
MALRQRSASVRSWNTAASSDCPASSRSSGLEKLIVSESCASGTSRPALRYVSSPARSSTDSTVSAAPSCSLMRSPSLNITRRSGAVFSAYCRCSFAAGKSTSTRPNSARRMIPSPSSGSGSLTHRCPGTGRRLLLMKKGRADYGMAPWRQRDFSASLRPAAPRARRRPRRLAG